jgi:hypothetical protein
VHVARSRPQRSPRPRYCKQLLRVVLEERARLRPRHRVALDSDHGAGVLADRKREPVAELAGLEPLKVVDVGEQDAPRVLERSAPTGRGERGRMGLCESDSTCGELPLPLETRELAPVVVDDGAVRSEPERLEDLGVAGAAAVAAEHERALEPGCRRQRVVAPARLHARAEWAGGAEPAPTELHAQAVTLESARELVDADGHDERRLRSCVFRTRPPPLA